MYTPSLETAKSLVTQGNLIPIFRDVPADLETPVSAYLKVARPPYSFLLESVEGGERLARYSFIGTEPYRVVKTGQGQPDGNGDPLTLVEKELARFRPVREPGLPRFVGGAVGYLAYDAVRHFEPRVGVAPDDPLKMPESVLMFTDTLLVFDHLKHRIQVVSHIRVGPDGGIEAAYKAATARIEALVDRLRGPLQPPRYTPPEGWKRQAVTSNFTREGYHIAVEQVKEYIRAGDVIQVVLSQRLARRTWVPSFGLYRSLRATNPSPYMYYLDLDEFQIVGASPEMLVRVEDGEVTTHPIAGTRPRGADPEQDAAMEAELRASEKERAEHIMLVDLGRNDVGRVSRPGTVKVTQLMEVERYSHVMHLVSHVTGRLREGLTCFDALRACFPAGTVSGAPKVRAMEIIRELEGQRRGPYAGAVGYFGFSGNMDTAIAIRTMVVKDGVAYVQAGGGLVFDSTPEGEYEETLQKSRASLRAIELAEQPLM